MTTRAMNDQDELRQDVDRVCRTVTSGRTLYTPPSDHEFRSILKWLELTNGEATRLLGFSHNRFRKYTGGISSVPYPMLYVLVHIQTDRVVQPTTWRESLQEWGWGE